MGQKVNPHGLRVGIISAWDTQWYADKKDFAKNLKEVPEEILDTLHIELVEHVDEVLPLALAARRDEIFPETSDSVSLTQSLRLDTFSCPESDETAGDSVQ